ncbi:MAG: energy transducer TonB [Pseudomonadaceae bacterium]|nr:energy transducer TonB [Pseudomonadaceae bacterium]
MHVYLPSFRYAPALLLATGITFCLFLIMELAIKSGDVTLLPSKPGTVVEIVRPRKDEPIIKKDHVVEPPPKVVPPPTAKVTPEIDGGLTEILDLKFAPPTREGPMIAAQPDGDMIPIMRVPPEFPQRMLSRGISGWVLVEFTVDTLGRVVSPMVLDAQPANGFQKAALDAIVRYKFKPRVVDGRSVPVTGVRQRIFFNLQN